MSNISHNKEVCWWGTFDNSLRDPNHFVRVEWMQFIYSVNKLIREQKELSVYTDTTDMSEIGGFGSQYFSRQFNPEEVKAMFNIEMIGTESKWGTNSAYITGYEKTDMGKINSGEIDFQFTKELAGFKIRNQFNCGCR